MIAIKKPLIVIAGPTASGKTDISIKLAKKIDAEIISADSMQVYKYMDIGTAKPSRKEMDNIKHYLIDELYPDEDYSIAVFQRMAKKYLNDIYEKNKIPILCGGTGFYINSVIYDNNFMVTNNNYEYRNELYKLAKEKGNDYIHNMLYDIDLESCNLIHPNNLKRVVRALEYFKETGEKISCHNKTERSRELNYKTTFIIINRDRNILYERINKRVDMMIENGLVEEVENLIRLGYSKDLVSMQGLGYKEIVQYLDSELSLDEAIELLKRDTRRFAKRQLTWFKHQCDGYWIDADDKNVIDKIIDYYTSSS